MLGKLRADAETRGDASGERRAAAGGSGSGLMEAG